VKDDRSRHERSDDEGCSDLTRAMAHPLYLGEGARGARLFYIVK
jgi:hypothetical protein